MKYSVLRWKYQRNWELPKVSFLGFDNNSKMMEMSVDFTIQIAPMFQCRMAVTPKRSRWNSASDLSRQLSAATGTTVSKQTMSRHLRH
ncbi:hypothetical protein TNCV_5055391 [Trichonephila clavipes]|nr:hypothetical protein TNCV_5055391 [Trichonephila clavipes]